MNKLSRLHCCVVASLSLLCGGLAVSAQAADFKIADIQIEGLQRVSPGPVFAALPVQAGDFADGGTVASIMRSLFATGFFSDIQVLHEGGVLIVRVTERPSISEVTLDGNKAIKTEQLEEVMKDNGLKEGEILKRDVLDGLMRELERQYVAQGRYSAKVEPTIEDKPNNQVAVAINIDEGKVAGILHINVVGNKTFSDKELTKSFESKKRGWLSWLTSNNRYAKERLKGDIEKLESFYLDRGYLDFKLVSSQVSLSPDKRNIYITLNVHEGEVYTVNALEVAGDPILPLDVVTSLIQLQKGEKFAQNLMTGTSEYITELLGNAGYTNAKVEGIPEKNEKDKTVKVTFFVDPKERVYVRRVLFKGNARTQDDVLRRETRQMESASASKSRIEQGKIRLERLGYFKEVKTENIPVPGTEDQIDVQYTVEEQHSDSISASIGYSQGIGASVGANLQVNNWLGTGKQVGVNLSYDEYRTLYSFSYVDPYFTPDGVSRGISLFYQTIDNDVLGATNYNTNSYGANLTFGYPVSEVQRINLGLGYSFLEVLPGFYPAEEIKTGFLQPDLSAYPYVAITESEQDKLVAALQDTGSEFFTEYSAPLVPVNNSMLFDKNKPGFVDLYGSEFHSTSASIGWLRNTLNRGILATRGNMQSVNLEVTAPESDLQYYKLEMKGQYFQPITNDFVLRLKGNFSYGDGYGDMDRLPFFENFYAGGFGSVRGFERSSLGPRPSPTLRYDTSPTDVVPFDSDGDGVFDAFDTAGSALVLCESDGVRRFGFSQVECQQGKAQLAYSPAVFGTRSIGGNMLVELSSELIFPIPFLDDQRSVQTALFVDAGNVFDTECGPYQANCYRFEWDKLSASYGVGLSWISPMGPLTFSVAKPFQFNSFDERETFQFSFGSGF